MDSDVEKEKEENFNHLLMDSSVEKTRDPPGCLMKTHFLKPYVTSINGPVAELPPRRRRVSVSSSSDVKVPSLRSFANGFLSPNHNLRSWTRKMEALHEPTWRKAGIFEAIKASTFKIRENPSLIQALVEKWCPETKSFVFPWGEATVTLEDVMVLLGFSVLGSPVCASLESSEVRVAVEKLEKERVKLYKGKGGCVSQLQWTSSFNDDELEHEAFLAMWLSHLVFPYKTRSSISKKVFPIAVRLARGERVALAPAVLACLYRDLGRVCTVTGDKFIAMSQLKLVQVWTWERFQNVRPEPGEIPMGEPRIAQWSLLKQRCDGDERFSFDDFDWRPYTKPLHNWNPLRVYVEEAMWVTVDNNLDDEFVAFARCVRSSQLVGIGFVEDYYPNRVAMQFGFSQDLPGLVTHHSKVTEKEAWDDYNRSLVGLKLYMPSRLATGSVTTRYRDWWSKSVSQFLGFEELNETCSASNTVDDALLQKLGEGFPAEFKRSRKLRIARRMGFEIKKRKTGDCGAPVSVEVPLSELFHKELAKRTSEQLRGKRARDNDDDDDDDDDDNENHMETYDDITIAQLVKSRKKDGGEASGTLGIKRRGKDDNNESRICQELAPGDDDDTVTPQEVEKRNVEKAEEEDKEITVLNPFVGDTLLSPPGPEAGQTCVDVNGSNNPEKKKTLIEDVGDTSESLGRRRDKEDNNASRICQDLACGDDESVAPQAIEPQTEENDEEETRSVGCVEEEITVLIPCVGDNVLPPPEARQICVDVNGGNSPEKKKKTLVDDGTNDGEKQRFSVKERLKQRKLTIEETSVNLEARFLKVEKTLETIRNWITKRNHNQTGVSA